MQWLPRHSPGSQSPVPLPWKSEAGAHPRGVGDHAARENLHREDLQAGKDERRRKGAEAGKGRKRVLAARDGAGVRQRSRARPGPLGSARGAAARCGLAFHPV